MEEALYLIPTWFLLSLPWGRLDGPPELHVIKLVFLGAEYASPANHDGDGIEGDTAIKSPSPFPVHSLKERKLVKMNLGRWSELRCLSTGMCLSSAVCLGYVFGLGYAS